MESKIRFNSFKRPTTEIPDSYNFSKGSNKKESFDDYFLETEEFPQYKVDTSASDSSYSPNKYKRKNVFFNEHIQIIKIKSYKKDNYRNTFREDKKEEKCSCGIF